MMKALAAPDSNRDRASGQGWVSTAIDRVVSTESAMAVMKAVRRRPRGRRIEASAPVNGQIMTAELPRIVSYDMVTQAIDFANANGWKPNESGPPFHCKYLRRGFQMTD